MTKQLWSKKRLTEKESCLCSAIFIK